MKILIVDDEPNILNIVEAYLMANSYQVFRAKDGKESLKQAETVLPDISGLEVCRKIREASADRDKIYQVITNLLANAIKLPLQAVILTCTVGKIEIPFLLASRTLAKVSLRMKSAKSSKDSIWQSHPVTVN